MIPPTPILPIFDALPALREALKTSPVAILSAEPGAGKTTHVPFALLEEKWLENRRIVMLEPRRLAARRAAEYMARQFGESPGQTVGYRIRGEARVGPSTRIEIVTEGILTRILQDEPDLPGTGLVIFDEFHERTIHADLGLALTLDVQEHLRPDLRILLMSATLDGLSLSRILGNAPVVASKGSSYPVDTHYVGIPSERPLEARVAEVITMALRNEEGDILVFLPGRREIRRTETHLYDRKVTEQARVHVLHGDADTATQTAALARDPHGRRKIILSTSIAETSLTIDGIKTIIDSGLARVPRFDPRRGMSGLTTVPVSKAVADQRRGRAGRLAPGICYRLWTEEQHADLPLYPTPEILSADLAPMALDLALWGCGPGTTLRFLDHPPAAHLTQARSLLCLLGALDREGQLTLHGRRMADIPTHPRLAHMMIQGNARGIGYAACQLAALLEEKDVLAGRSDVDIDIRHRWDALREKGGLDRLQRDRILQQARRFSQILAVEESEEDVESLGVLLAFAYPERVARRRGDEGRRYVMANGTGALLPEGSRLTKERYLAIGDVDGVGIEARVFLAAPLSEGALAEIFTEQFTENDEIDWNDAEGAVVCRHVVRLGAIVVNERHIEPYGEKVTGAVIKAIRSLGLASLPWTRESTALQVRSEWLRSQGLVGSGWPALDDASLRENLELWLEPFLVGIWRRNHFAHIPLLDALRSRFHPDQLHDLDRLAPASMTLPSGRRASIEYRKDTDPVLAVPLQELFGQTDSPRIAGGRVRLLLHILSPARRPLAVTQDLQSFWHSTYPEIRTQMRSRYPKHNWPEDPLTARPPQKTSRKVAQNFNDGKSVKK